MYIYIYIMKIIIDYDRYMINYIIMIDQRVTNIIYCS